MNRAELVESCLESAASGMRIAWAHGARDDRYALIPPTLSLIEGSRAWAHALLVPALKVDALPSALVLPAGAAVASGCVSGLVFTADAISDDDGRADLDPPVERWKRDERDGLSQRLIAFGSWPDGEVHVMARTFVTDPDFTFTSEAETMRPFAGMVHSALEHVWAAGKLLRAARRAQRARLGAEFDVRYRPALAAVLVGMGCPVILASDIRREVAARTN